jgi:hypothetical protein
MASRFAAQPVKSPTARALAVVLLLAAVISPFSVSSWQITDHDALLRLASGRTIAELGAPPLSDPLTFSRPDSIWCNPEWLGDLLWWHAHQLGGFEAVIVLKQSIIVFALLLLALLMWRTIVVRRGVARHDVAPQAPHAALALIAAVLLLGLYAAASRLTVRNHLHAYWMIALYGHLLLSARERPWLVLGTLPAGLLWSNLHSSFLLGWGLLAAHAIERAFEKRQDDRWKPLRFSALALAIHPLLPLLGPFGTHAYDQLLDHAWGADVYGNLILEWQKLENTAADPSQLAFHLLALIALFSFLPKRNRTQLGGALLLAAALMMGYRAHRFAPLLLFLAGPTLVANLYMSGVSLKPRGRQIATLVAATCALTLAGSSFFALAKPQRPPLLKRPGPLLAARFLSRHAAPRARLFNPFNAGAILLWKAQGTQLYIDPRNNLGHEHLRHYLDVLASPERFEDERAKRPFDLVLCDLRWPRFAKLNAHLAQKRKTWRPIYFDGRYVLYVHRAAQPHYRPLELEVLRPTTNLSYLPDEPIAYERDLARLKRAKSTAMLSLLRGYLALRRAGRDQSAHRQAAALLQTAMRGLPASPYPLAYLALAWHGAGELQRARKLIASGLALFPRSQMLRALKNRLVAP